MKGLLIFIVALLPLQTRADIVFSANLNLLVAVSSKEAAVVHTALEIFNSDYQLVFGAKIQHSTKAQVFIGTIGTGSEAEAGINKKRLNDLRAHTEGYALEVKGNKLYILGSDKRGTAYGILELSRLIGISPWEWWADVRPNKKQSFKLQNGYSKLESPSVKYRGIFINDEDWGLNPWSTNIFEPGLPLTGQSKGTIGPKTYAKVFELLLRLRANTIWPAMHEVTVPFYFTKGNREVADKYGIIISTTHCEPLMRNSATEWDISGKGDYNYVTNKDAIQAYWIERLKELKNSENIYTIGLRGKHDGMMQGVKTLPQHKAVLKNVIKDERDLLKKYINEEVDKIPQIFIPYKEVLDVYNDGLEVPEDVTLIWCDDNYGYIRHFPTEKEKARKGGNGIYYHISYWGRPHDYLWLATTHPALLYTQMKMAYDKGANDFWVLNVGDIKPGEYLTELFLDMAWDIKAIDGQLNGVDKHLREWLEREFGSANANELLNIMKEYYRLAYIRKPEFMGGTRTEEKDSAYKQIKDLPWTETEIRQRIKDYDAIANKVIQLSATLPQNRKDAWFQLIGYPVCGAAAINKKLLFGQLAMHKKENWDKSDNAHNTVIQLTQKYNTLANGKWRGIMSFKPRNLEVFEKVPRSRSVTAKAMFPALFTLNGKDYKNYSGEKPVYYGLGYSGGAVHLSKGSKLTYTIPHKTGDSLTIELALAPNHPVEGKMIRYAIQVNDGKTQVVDFATRGRSEEWKENVLTNQARRTTSHSANKKTKQVITIEAMDEGVVIDQIKVW